MQVTNHSPEQLTIMPSHQELGVSEDERMDILFELIKKSITFKTLLAVCQETRDSSFDISNTFSCRNTILSKAASVGNNDVVIKFINKFGTKLINVGSLHNLPPICSAARNKHYLTVLHLLAFGADINLLITNRDFGGNADEVVVKCTTLIKGLSDTHPSFKASSALTLAAREKANTKILALLLRHGARADWFVIEDYSLEVCRRIQEAKQTIADEDQSFTQLLKGRIDPKSILYKMPKEIIQIIVNRLLWS